MEWMFNNAEGTGNALINDISRVAHDALNGGGGSIDISGVIETSGILLTPVYSAEGSSQSVITDLDPSTNPLMSKEMVWINKAQDKSAGWSYVAPMDVSRMQLGAAALGGKLYVVGGYASSFLQTAEVYDPVDNSWNSIASFPFTRGQAGAAALGGKLYVVGGTPNPSNPPQYYDPSENSWNPIASMNSADRQFPCVAALGRKLYAVGGSTSSLPQGAPEVYDPVKNIWKYIAPMNTPRWWAAWATLGGKLYVAGGYDLSGAYATISLKTAEVYDPVKNSWNYIAPMNTAREACAGAALGGKFYVISGENNIASVEVYDPADPSGGWVYDVSINIARRAPGAVALGGKLYVVGGQSTGLGEVNTTEIYDPSLVQMPQITYRGEDFYISHARGGPKTFIIPHPEHEGKMLRHACLEAPTRGTNVYEYQITTTEDNQTTEIALPSYFKHLNGRPRVYVYAGKGEGWKGGCGGYVNSDLTHAIIQTQKTGTFNIMVTGVRKDPQAIAYSVTENIDAPIALEDIPTK